eukprot:g10696.t1
MGNGYSSPPGEVAGLFQLAKHAAGKPLKGDALGNPLSSVKREQLALVLHTSGTTKKPKIVPLTHANIACGAKCIASTVELKPADGPVLFHIHGLIVNILASAVAGSQVVCLPGVFQVQNFHGALVAQPEPNWYSAVPTMHLQILQFAEEVAKEKGKPPENKLELAWLNFLTSGVSCAHAMATVEGTRRFVERLVRQQRLAPALATRRLGPLHCTALGFGAYRFPGEAKDQVPREILQRALSSVNVPIADAWDEMYGALFEAFKTLERLCDEGIISCGYGVSSNFLSCLFSVTGLPNLYESLVLDRVLDAAQAAAQAENCQSCRNAWENGAVLGREAQAEGDCFMATRLGISLLTNRPINALPIPGVSSGDWGRNDKHLQLREAKPMGTTESLLKRVLTEALGEEAPLQQLALRLALSAPGSACTLNGAHRWNYLDDLEEVLTKELAAEASSFAWTPWQYGQAIQACRRTLAWPAACSFLAEACSLRLGNILLFSSCLRATSAADRWVQAAQLLARVDGLQLRGDGILFNAALQGPWEAALGHLRRLEGANMAQALRGLEDSALQHLKATVVSLNSVLSAMSLASWSLPLQIFRTLKRLNSLKPDVISYTALVSHMAGMADGVARWWMSVRLLQELRQQGLSPNRVSLNSLMATLPSCSLAHGCQMALGFRGHLLRCAEPFGPPERGALARSAADLLSSQGRAAAAQLLCLQRDGELFRSPGSLDAWMRSEDIFMKGVFLLLASFKATGLRMDTILRSSLVNVYQEGHHWKGALDMLEAPNLVAYCAVMGATSSASRTPRPPHAWRRAVQLYAALQWARVGALSACSTVCGALEAERSARSTSSAELWVELQRRALSVLKRSEKRIWRDKGLDRDRRCMSMPICSNPRYGKRKLRSVGMKAGPDMQIMNGHPDNSFMKVGEEGEVVVKHGPVTSGYEFRDHMDANPNIEAFGDGWLRTARGRALARGWETYGGEIINRAGEKISPFEVEDAMRANDAFKDCIAFAVPHKSLGEVVGIAGVLKDGKLPSAPQSE